MKKKQLGGTILGFILGVIVGLGAALAVAVYVTKVPVPFLNKGAARGADQDAAEAQKNKDWDPNSLRHWPWMTAPTMPRIWPASITSWRTTVDIVVMPTRQRSYLNWVGRPAPDKLTSKHN